MKKRVFIIHGWSGKPDSNWFPWLKKELEKEDFEVFIPQMPDADYPIIEKWVGHLTEIIKNPDQDTYLIGHSMGCQTILRYIDQNNAKIGGIILVAGFFSLTNLESDEELKISEPWLQTSINYQTIKENCPHIVAIFSNNDPYVPIENVDMFKQRLNSENIIIKNSGHLGGEDGFTELPIVKEKLVEISK